MEVLLDWHPKQTKTKIVDTLEDLLRYFLGQGVRTKPPNSA